AFTVPRAQSISAQATSIRLGCFFFSSRRRHTRSKRDWSSDVCSPILKKDMETSQDKSINSSIEKSVFKENKIKAGNVMYSINCVMTCFALSLNIFILRHIKPMQVMI